MEPLDVSGEIGEEQPGEAPIPEDHFGITDAERDRWLDEGGALTKDD